MGKPAACPTSCPADRHIRLTRPFHGPVQDSAGQCRTTSLYARWQKAPQQRAPRKRLGRGSIHHPTHACPAKQPAFRLAFPPAPASHAAQNRTWASRTTPQQIIEQRVAGCTQQASDAPICAKPQKEAIKTGTLARPYSKAALVFIASQHSVRVATRALAADLFTPWAHGPSCPAATRWPKLWPSSTRPAVPIPPSARTGTGKRLCKALRRQTLLESLAS